MRSTKKLLWAFSLFDAPFNFSDRKCFRCRAVTITRMTTVPEVTARVARISYISGDVQIRRADSREWEKAVQNLPIVEGDEIATAGQCSARNSIKQRFLSASVAKFVSEIFEFKGRRHRRQSFRRRFERTAFRV